MFNHLATSVATDVAVALQIVITITNSNNNHNDNNNNTNDTTNNNHSNNRGLTLSAKSSMLIGDVVATHVLQLHNLFVTFKSVQHLYHRLFHLDFSFVFFKHDFCLLSVLGA